MTFRSGFVTFIGRPNVGKSTLLNRILGTKVSIVSDKPQTTRTQVRGVLNRPDAQVVFVDTPGIHKPVTALGTKLNETANEALSGVDVVCLVIDATMPLGRGDKFVAAGVPDDAVGDNGRCPDRMQRFIVGRRQHRHGIARIALQFVGSLKLLTEPDDTFGLRLPEMMNGEHW